MAHTPCKAQAIPPVVTVVIDDELPPNPVNYTWVYDPTQQNIHVYKRGKWEIVRSGRFDSIQACSRWVVLKERGKIIASNATGEAMFDNCEGTYCSDDIFGFWGPYYAEFDDPKGNLITCLYGSGSAQFHLDPVTVQGQTAFCLPSYFIGNVYFYWNDLRCWGILGSNGKWLIEPKFDAPFRFVNGVAEVNYKGEARKINENGEWIQ